GSALLHKVRLSDRSLCRVRTGDRARRQSGLAGGRSQRLVQVLTWVEYGDSAAVGGEQSGPRESDRPRADDSRPGGLLQRSRGGLPRTPTHLWHLLPTFLIRG